VQAVSSPRSTPLPVSRSTSHEVATPCVIVPEADRTWLKNQERYAGVSNDRKDRRRLGRVSFSAADVACPIGSPSSEITICYDNNVYLTGATGRARAAITATQTHDAERIVATPAAASALLAVVQWLGKSRAVAR
jgi:hypothetical protein